MAISRSWKTVRCSARDGRHYSHEFVRRRAGRALRPARWRSLRTGRRDVVERPVARMAGLRGVTFGARFQRADACFNRPIIPWRTRRREQQIHARTARKNLACRLGNERRTVIGFQDQGRAVTRRRGTADAWIVSSAVRRAHGQPQELLAAGQVAHRQEVGIQAIDGLGRFAEVHGPDGAGTVPVEAVRALLVTLPPDAAVALERSSSSATRHRGEAVAQGGHAGGGAEFIQHLQDVHAVGAR